jgi:hypothetical protein
VTANQSFPMTARHLRIVQVVCILLALSGAWLIHHGKSTSNDVVTPVHWFIVLAAIYCATAGFTVQRRIIQAPKRLQTTKSSTPLSRWRAGNLIRLSMATSVSLWGTVLSVYRGPTWLAFTFFALGLIQLLIWTPGNTPVMAQPELSK